MIEKLKIKIHINNILLKVKEINLNNVWKLIHYVRPIIPFNSEKNCISELDRSEAACMSVRILYILDPDGCSSMSMHIYTFLHLTTHTVFFSRTNTWPHLAKAITNLDPPVTKIHFSLLSECWWNLCRYKKVGSRNNTWRVLGCFIYTHLYRSNVGRESDDIGGRRHLKIWRLKPWRGTILVLFCSSSSS